MKKRTATLFIAILVGLIGISLVGYAGAQAQSCAQSMPQLLQEAGFKPFLATPQQQAYMEVCPKNCMMIQTKGTQTVYAFADQPSNTIFYGNKADYERFKTLCQKANTKVKEENIENDPNFWNMWQSSRGVG